LELVDCAFEFVVGDAVAAEGHVADLPFQFLSSYCFAIVRRNKLDLCKISGHPYHHLDKDRACLEVVAYHMSDTVQLSMAAFAAWKELADHKSCRMRKSLVDMRDRARLSKC